MFNIRTVQYICPRTLNLTTSINRTVLMKHILNSSFINYTHSSYPPVRRRLGTLLSLYMNQRVENKTIYTKQ